MDNLNIENIGKTVESFLKNEYVSTILGLFLVMYGGLAAPKLPPQIAKMFENPLFRLVIMVLIAYMSTKNQSIALVAAVGLVITFQTLNRIKADEAIMSILEVSARPSNDVEVVQERDVAEEEDLVASAKPVTENSEPVENELVVESDDNVENFNAVNITPYDGMDYASY